MIQVLYLYELVNLATHDLVSLAVKASCTLVSTRPVSSQTLDNRESAFFFPLSATRYFFRRGVISSTKVAGDVALVAVGTEATSVMGVSFSMTCTTLFPRLERGSFFLALILAYIPRLNFVVIFAKEKQLFFFKKKKKGKEKSKSITNQKNTYSSSL